MLTRLCKRGEWQELTGRGFLLAPETGFLAGIDHLLGLISGMYDSPSGVGEQSLLNVFPSLSSL